MNEYLIMLYVISCCNNRSYNQRCCPPREIPCKCEVCGKNPCECHHSPCECHHNPCECHRNPCECHHSSCERGTGCGCSSQERGGDFLAFASQLYPYISGGIGCPPTPPPRKSHPCTPPPPSACPPPKPCRGGGCDEYSRYNRRYRRW